MINLLLGFILALLTGYQPQTATQDSSAAVQAKGTPVTSKTYTFSTGLGGNGGTKGVKGTKAFVLDKDGLSGGKHTLRVIDGDDDEHVIDLSGIAALAEIDGLDEEINTAIQSALAASKDWQGAQAQLMRFRNGNDDKPFVWRMAGEEVEYDEHAAFLGVSTEPVTQPTSAQLPITAGTGLLLTMVEKDSPAAAAGLKEMDVLAKIDDQLLINAPQLAVLIRTHKPGEEVKLTYVRGGKEMTAKVKLGDRKLPKLSPGGQRADGSLFNPGTGMVELQGLNAPGLAKLYEGSRANLTPARVRAFAPAAAASPSAPDAEDASSGSMSISYSTDKVSVEYTKDGENVHVNVTDLESDETIFDEDREPTKEEISKMPQEIRKDVQRLLSDVRTGSARRRIQVAPVAPVPPTPPVPPAPPAGPSSQAPETSAENESLEM